MLYECFVPIFIFNTYICRQEAHPGTILCPVGADIPMCSAAWVSVLLRASAACGQPIVSTLFRPVGPSGRYFVERAVQSTAINERLKHHLMVHKLYCGQSTHGFRRGRLQYEEAQGKTLQQLMDLALVSTASVMKGRYLNKQAHLRV